MGLIYLGTCVLRYAVKNDPVHGETTRQRLAEAADVTLAISPLVRMECLVGPMRTSDRGLRLRYEQALGMLKMLDMPPGLRQRRLTARPLRASHPRRAASGLRPAPRLPSAVDE
jgi:hypothetical protein